jgi:hypothetical protein
VFVEQLNPIGEPHREHYYLLDKTECYFATGGENGKLYKIPVNVKKSANEFTFDLKESPVVISAIDSEVVVHDWYDQIVEVKATTNGKIINRTNKSYQSVRIHANENGQVSGFRGNKIEVIARDQSLVNVTARYFGISREVLCFATDNAIVNIGGNTGKVTSATFADGLCNYQ